MNVALMKTKAETALTEAFEQVAPLLPGSGEVAAARKAALGRFAAHGLPHRRIEEWKYTDLRNVLKEAQPPAVADQTRITIADVIVALGPFATIEAARIVFVNGTYRAELSNLSSLTGVDVEPLSQALAREGGTALIEGAEAGPLLALNSAYATDGALVRVKDGVTLEKPLLVAFVAASKEARAASVRNILAIGAKARASVAEVFVTLPGASLDGQVNAASEITVGDGAVLTHVKAAVDKGRVTHLSNWRVAIGAGAAYRGFQLTGGTAIARNDITVTFNGEGSKLDLSGAFLGKGGEHIDTTLVVDHAVPHCESRELFKGVLDGHARGIFQGKIIVRPDAQKTDGKQMAQALMLSQDAEFDSKPELEIYADDVVCGHGSTAAELDPDLMFYCRSRGIPTAEARALLISSFVGEAIERVEDEQLKGALAALASDWLNGLSG